MPCSGRQPHGDPGRTQKFSLRFLYCLSSRLCIHPLPFSPSPIPRQFTSYNVAVPKLTPLAEKLEQVRERIAAAAAKARREVSEITLVAVTKTAPPEQIREILQLGVTDLGESRAQVLTQRAAQLNEFFSRRLGRTEPDPSASAANPRETSVAHDRPFATKQSEGGHAAGSYDSNRR